MQSARIPLPMIVLAASLGILGLMAGALAWRAFEARPPQAPAVLIVLPEPRTVSDFALEDHHGQPFSLSGFRGRWSILFFGFTNCPDVCPNTLYVLQQVRSRLQQDLPAEALPAVYLVSVDPDRDSAERMAAYLGHFDPTFTGLTGDDAMLRALTMQLGIMYHIEPHAAGALDYAVDHSASLLLLDPQGRLFGVFSAPHDAERIVAELTRLLKRAEPS